MVSAGTNCEIVEVKNDALPQGKSRDRELRPPLLKKGYTGYSEDDINKLFESVNVRTSKSLDLSDSWRSASKRPMRSPGSLSPGIGFSEAVSLKQALRGLCISQAAEMAATKRFSITSASPRISEAGKSINSCRSGTEESTSYSTGSLTRRYRDSFKKSAPQSSCSSPSYSNKPDIKSLLSVSSELGHQVPDYDGSSVEKSLVDGENVTCSDSNNVSTNQSADSSSQVPSTSELADAESSPVCMDISQASEVDQLVDETTHALEEKHYSHDNVSEPDSKISGQSKAASGPVMDSATSLEVVKRAGPRLRRKSKLPSPGAAKTNKEAKSAKTTPRTVKTVVRNKNLIIKKSKKVDGYSESSSEVNGSSDHGSGKLICQRCQCALRETVADSSGNPPEATRTEGSTNGGNCVATKSDSVHVNKTNTNMKIAEKVDISQSSSSICDFSSSTTSLSEESSLSGSTCGNRPHMSKDVRWGAINHVRKQYGFVGLSHFNLQKKLGSGDIGTVYLAELIGTSCPFAIKVMDNEFLGRRKKMPRAQTEREILRILDHPFLPTLYTQFTSDNLSCLVMEYCPGGDLHVLRQKQPGRYFPEQEARYIDHISSSFATNSVLGSFICA